MRVADDELGDAGGKSGLAGGIDIGSEKLTSFRRNMLSNAILPIPRLFTCEDTAGAVHVAVHEDLQAAPFLAGSPKDDRRRRCAEEVAPGQLGEKCVCHEDNYTATAMPLTSCNIARVRILDMGQWPLVLFTVLPIAAQPNGVELFESKIRPVLADKCYPCHSLQSKSPMGNLTLDTKAALQRGGASGPALVPGKPDESRL